MEARRRERVDRGIKVRSESIYALSSPVEMAYLAAPRVLLVAGFLLLPLVLLPWPFWSQLSATVGIFAFLALSFDLLANHAGLVCLGGAFFYGVGGYTTAMLDSALGLPAPLSVLASVLVGAAICTVAMFPCLPLRGIYFAVVSLMYPLLASRLVEATGVLGGTEGMGQITAFRSPGVARYGILVLMLVAVFGMRRLMAETPGLVLRAVKDNEQAVRASGINVTWCRTRALFLGAALGCFSGAYYAHLYGTVGISYFGLEISVLPIAMTVVGGSGTLVGPVLGSLMLVYLGEALRKLGSPRMLIFSALLVVFIVLRSEGLLPFVARRYHQFQRWTRV